MWSDESSSTLFWREGRIRAAPIRPGVCCTSLWGLQWVNSRFSNILCPKNEVRNKCNCWTFCPTHPILLSLSPFHQSARQRRKQKCFQRRDGCKYSSVCSLNACGGLTLWPVHSCHNEQPQACRSNCPTTRLPSKCTIWRMSFSIDGCFAQLKPWFYAVHMTALSLHCCAGGMPDHNTFLFIVVSSS